MSIDVSRREHAGAGPRGSMDADDEREQRRGTPRGVAFPGLDFGPLDESGSDTSESDASLTGTILEAEERSHAGRRLDAPYAFGTGKLLDQQNIITESPPDTLRVADTMKAHDGLDDFESSSDMSGPDTPHAETTGNEESSFAESPPDTSSAADAIETHGVHDDSESSSDMSDPDTSRAETTGTQEESFNTEPDHKPAAAEEQRGHDQVFEPLASSLKQLQACVQEQALLPDEITPQRPDVEVLNDFLNIDCKAINALQLCRAAVARDGLDSVADDANGCQSAAYQKGNAMLARARVHVLELCDTLQQVFEVYSTHHTTWMSDGREDDSADDGELTPEASDDGVELQLETHRFLFSENSDLKTKTARLEEQNTVLRDKAAHYEKRNAELRRKVQSLHAAIASRDSRPEDLFEIAGVAKHDWHGLQIDHSRQAQHNITPKARQGPFASETPWQDGDMQPGDAGPSRAVDEGRDSSRGTSLRSGSPDDDLWMSILDQDLSTGSAKPVGRQTRGPQKRSQLQEIERLQAFERYQDEELEDVKFRYERMPQDYGGPESPGRLFRPNSIYSERALRAFRPKSMLSELSMLASSPGLGPRSPALISRGGPQRFRRERRGSAAQPAPLWEEQLLAWKDVFRLLGYLILLSIWVPTSLVFEARHFFAALPLVGRLRWEDWEPMARPQMNAQARGLIRASRQVLVLLTLHAYLSLRWERDIWVAANSQTRTYLVRMQQREPMWWPIPCVDPAVFWSRVNGMAALLVTQTADLWASWATRK